MKHYMLAILITMSTNINAKDMVNAITENGCVLIRGIQEIQIRRKINGKNIEFVDTNEKLYKAGLKINVENKFCRSESKTTSELLTLILAFPQYYIITKHIKPKDYRHEKNN